MKYTSKNYLDGKAGGKNSLRQVKAAENSYGKNNLRGGEAGGKNNLRKGKPGGKNSLSGGGFACGGGGCIDSLGDRFERVVDGCIEAVMPERRGEPRQFDGHQHMPVAFTLSAPMFMGMSLGILLLAQLIVMLRKKIRRERYHARMREMRAIRKPQAVNPPPSPEELAAQWDRVHDSLEEMLKFGRMLTDLEASDLIDNSPILNYDTPDGIPEIVARNSGLKGWLAEHCPHIGYKTAMRYKSLAQKARKAPQKTPQLIQESRCINDLYGNLHKELKLRRYVLEHPRQPRRKPGGQGFKQSGSVPESHKQSRSKPRSHAFRRPGSGGRKVQPLIFSIRSQAHGAIQEMTPEQRQQLVASLRSLAEDICNIV